MTRFWACSAAIGLVMNFGLAAAQNADVMIQNGMVSRLSFSEMSDNEQSLYVAGVTDGILVSPMVSSNSIRERALALCLSDRKIGSEQIRLTTIQEIQKIAGETGRVCACGSLHGFEENL